MILRRPMSGQLFGHTNNVPESLWMICLKHIVSNDIPFKNVCLPQEICNNLLEAFRHQNANTVDTERVSRFISQFKAETSPISEARLADLPITDQDLYYILSEHTNTLKYLDIDNCRELSDSALLYIRYLPTRINSNNLDKLVVTVRVFEQRNKDTHNILLDKRYEKGVITSNLGMCEATYVGVKNNFITIFDEMGVFEYGFDTLRRKLSKMADGRSLIRKYATTSTTTSTLPNGNLFSSSSPSSFEKSDLMECLVRPLGKSATEPLVSGYDSPVFEDSDIIRDHVRSDKDGQDIVRYLDYKAWCKSPLETLIIGKCNQIFPDSEPDLVTIAEKKQHLLNPYLPLQTLVIHEVNPSGNQRYLDTLITPMMNETLTYLDLSNCNSIGDGQAFTSLKNLKVLILYNCPLSPAALRKIAQLKTLRSLDISSSNERHGHCFKSPDAQLAELVTALPNLTHLDISGTNLAGERADTIIGLSSRYDRPFEFLGLYNTQCDASFRARIPAVKVAGESTEDQILTACEVYMDRIEPLRKALNDLFHCFRIESEFHAINRSLNVVLTAMARHLNEKQIQIAASASLFYIVKSDEAKNYSPQVKRPIVTRLLDAMQRYKHDNVMLRNGSLTLIHFKLPQDVLFEYTRMVEILLLIVMNDDDDFIQRLGIYLLNSLACHVDGEQKTLVGDLGAIDKLITLIEARLSRRVCDEVMEIAWSTMWNVTDENPINCQRFLDNHGMDLFVKCMSTFPEPPELLRNMMGLLGNVAECEDLRPRLMRPEYIVRFSELLWSESDGIEVSYNAAGILSHIVSDGPEVWNQFLGSVDRDNVLFRMKTAIGRWTINSKRNINYRSFEPILRLLKSKNPVYEAQYWAVWALANLTRVYCSKYCQLLIDDGGVETLRGLLNDTQMPFHVKQLVDLTLYQVDKWKVFGHLDGLEESSEIEIGGTVNFF
ncbi:protein zer-1 homolog isoform X2 [Tetranychus urticae]|uniref:protein zer-1 homolog isoform X2 n=1 Tax=Tetranychus urticae TaxID=32264 RepID=UPI00077BFA2D|nr:protein zer-1 homolog isoform X2 [Tetranychus urticae]